MIDYYEILGIKYNERNEQVIIDAYRTRLKELRPDLNTDESTRRDFELLQRAKEIMSDPSKRTSYKMEYDSFHFSQMLAALRQEMKTTFDTIDALVGTK